MGEGAFIVLAQVTMVRRERIKLKPDGEFGSVHGGGTFLFAKRRGGGERQAGPRNNTVWWGHCCFRQTQKLCVRETFEAEGQNNRGESKAHPLCLWVCEVLACLPCTPGVASWYQVAAPPPPILEETKDGQPPTEKII
ncbi:UNVERIFIED_CONTAM: hypothetical protein K2H54_023490 [Gekko kuhli]